MFDLKVLEFVLRADEPICHIGETIGNVSLCMRSGQRMPDGSFVEVPCITGDTMRHQLREAAAFAILRAAGILEPNSLTEAALRLLFSGGQLTGGSGGGVKFNAYRELVELVPTLGLLGGCAQNRCIPGRLYVSPAILVCQETLHRLPENVIEWLVSTPTRIESFRRHIEEVRRVRMDPSLDSLKRKLLLEASQVEVNRRIEARERASDRSDNVGKVLEKSTMLPRSFERLVVGSIFYWKVSAMLLSDLDLDTFAAVVAAFLGDAHVGGRISTGHGKLSIVKSWGQFSSSSGELLKAHVSERKDRIRKFLSKVSA